jgi:late competence protein required for DNA uptake (superfamily II DNA/RNA helicase)
MSTSLTWKETLITDYLEDKNFAELLLLENESVTSINIIVPHILQKYEKITGNFDNVLIFKAGTGSGKSSTLPFNIYKKFNLNYGTIIVAQPRILTTQQNSSFVAKINGLTMGKEIGYKNGANEILPTDKFNILYVTHQIINNLMFSISPEKFTKKYPVVILDEIHESSSEITLVYFLVKEFIKKGCKSLFIFTSATLNEITIASYFNINFRNFYNFMYVKGNDENMKVNTFYFNENEKITEYLKNILDKTFIFGKYSENLKTISRKNDDKTPLIDTVIFCPTTNFINSIINIINNLYKDDIEKKNIVVISYKADDNKYKTINDITYNKMVEDYERKVSMIIVGTTVLETGVTIRRLNTVIDLGLKNDNISPVIGNFSNTVILPISESELLQRKGRAGRVGEGNYYSFFTKKAVSYLAKHDDIPGIKYPIPKIFVTKDFSINIILKYYQKISFDILKKENTNLVEFINFFDIDFFKLPLLSKSIKPFYINFDMINKIPFDMYIESFNYLFKQKLLNKNFSLSINGLIAFFFNNNISMTYMMTLLLLEELNPIDICYILSIFDKYETFEIKYIQGIRRKNNLFQIIVALKNLIIKDLTGKSLNEEDFKIINLHGYQTIQENFIDTFNLVFNFINKFNFYKTMNKQSYFKNEINDISKKINYLEKNIFISY